VENWLFCVLFHRITTASYWFTSNKKQRFEKMYLCSFFGSEWNFLSSRFKYFLLLFNTFVRSNLFTNWWDLYINLFKKKRGIWVSPRKKYMKVSILNKRLRGHVREKLRWETKNTKKFMWRYCTQYGTQDWHKKLQSLLSSKIVNLKSTLKKSHVWKRT
jgi:hypothetical protein